MQSAWRKAWKSEAKRNNLSCGWMSGRRVPGTFFERLAYLMLEVGAAPDGTVALDGSNVVRSER